MSRAEQYSWASLAGLCAVFWWFQMCMLDGWAIVDQPPSALFEIYIGVIAASIAMEIVIASMLGARRGKEAVEKDERDHAIDARASLNERLFVIAAVNVLIWQALWEGVMEGHLLPKVDLSHLPTLVFALFSILFGGEAVKRVSTIVLYRAQALLD